MNNNDIKTTNSVLHTIKSLFKNPVVAALIFFVVMIIGSSDLMM